MHKPNELVAGVTMRRKTRRNGRLGKVQSKARSPSPEVQPRAPQPNAGQFVKGNTAALKHGQYSTRARQALLPGQEAQLAALTEDRQQLLEDLGGEATVAVTKRDVVRRFCELQVIADTHVSNLVREGVLTGKGRQRAALSAYLNVVDRLNKLAAQLGLERIAKPVPSIDEFLKTKEQL
jgi:hypothetical protein